MRSGCFAQLDVLRGDLEKLPREPVHRDRLADGWKDKNSGASRVCASWGLALWLAWKKAEPARAAYLLIGTILAFGPNGYSWYFTWIVPLLCFFPNPAWLMLTVLQFLSYNVLIGYGILGVFRFDPLMQWLVYAPFYAAALGQLVVRARESSAKLAEIRQT